MWWQRLTHITGSHQARCRAVLDKRFDGYHTLQLMTRGAVTLSYDDERHELEGAWAWPHHPGPRIRLQSRPRHGWWDHRHVAFTGPAVEDWVAAELFPRGPQPVRAVDELAALFDDYRRLIGEADPWSHGRAAVALERILLVLAAERGEDRREPWLRRVTAVLEEGRVDRFDAEALAAAVGMGASTLRRRFREETGRSLREWAITARLRRAARLLHEQPELPVATIAERLGYCDASAFTKQFRDGYGMTPRRYRSMRL